MPLYNICVPNESWILWMWSALLLICLRRQQMMAHIHETLSPKRETQMEFLAYASWLLVWSRSCHSRHKARKENFHWESVFYKVHLLRTSIWNSLITFKSMIMVVLDLSGLLELQWRHRYTEHDRVCNTLYCREWISIDYSSWLSQHLARACAKS